VARSRRRKQRRSSVRLLAGWAVAWRAGLEVGRGLSDANVTTGLVLCDNPARSRSSGSGVTNTVPAGTGRNPTASSRCPRVVTLWNRYAGRSSYRGVFCAAALA
jgi:hypothetical protein